MEMDLREFTDPKLFANRYCYSEFGPRASNWIAFQLESPIRAEYIGSQTPQNNVVIKIPGLSKNAVSVGAHMDSFQNKLKNVSGSEWIAPGADDNGSGSVVLLEVFRQFLSHIESVGPLQNAVQFHWYGAEEVGLLGSDVVFSRMRDNSLPLRAMLNLDMVGYPSGGFDKIGVQQDEHVDKNLTAFVRTLVKTVCNDLSSCYSHYLSFTISVSLLRGSPLGALLSRSHAIS